MKVRHIFWHDTLTDERGVYVDKNSLYIPDAEDELDYWWDEGNGSCDCNRLIMFKGEDYMTVACGDERMEIERWEWRDA